MRATPLLIGAALLAALAGGGWFYWQQVTNGRLPEGLVRANGRVEVERVDVATKYAGRVAAIDVEEGDFVQKGSVVARLDTAELTAELAAAKAQVRKAEAGIAQAAAQIALQQADLTLADAELKRVAALARRDNASQASVDQKTAQRDAARASLDGAHAASADAEATLAAARAEVTRIEAVLADMTLTAPVAGRVEYKLAQPGEVVAAGGRLVTLLDLTDVFMTIFLPNPQAGRLGLGDEARIVLDAAPQYVVPATVSFVAAEAQFTPKFVETESERAKLMFRIKLKIDPALLSRYRDYVKAGLTGEAYLRLERSVAWPDWLTPRLPDAGS
ncbi:HlyD family secretion protein [Tistlia consotensis]|uniref:HlyD family secretion protein n=1 Tax=Tistlia consotensis USBA 355 TaxID=560819 RepID=A0A1Y6CMG8_9PROT|nr:HlyD family efflux transporter periplasmic adaptor subunit [Tistlia consotensis]SMF60082.1 HlyD family secretion protein [Tistlia consotensis USBA 355]SNR93910.1 HlyD family secretion protein [Tistlia consotensis]